MIENPYRTPAKAKAVPGPATLPSCPVSFRVLVIVALVIISIITLIIHERHTLTLDVPTVRAPQKLRGLDLDMGAKDSKGASSKTLASKAKTTKAVKAVKTIKPTSQGGTVSKRAVPKELGLTHRRSDANTEKPIKIRVEKTSIEDAGSGGVDKTTVEKLSPPQLGQRHVDTAAEVGAKSPAPTPNPTFSPTHSPTFSPTATPPPTATPSAPPTAVPTSPPTNLPTDAVVAATSAVSDGRLEPLANPAGTAAGSVPVAEASKAAVVTPPRSPLVANADSTTTTTSTTAAAATTDAAGAANVAATAATSAVAAATETETATVAVAAATDAAPKSQPLATAVATDPHVPAVVVVDTHNCDGTVDPFSNLPVDTFKAPDKAPFQLKNEWQDAQKAMMDSIRAMSIGGPKLREFMTKEVRKLQAKRFELFCKFY